MSGERRKKLFKIPAKTAFAVCAVIALIHIVHALTLDRIMMYKEAPFVSPNVPAEMSGYRIAFVTDVHFISERRFARVVEELNSRQIDLLLLGGDFAGTRGEPERSLAMLAQVAAADGIYGVDGNHDRQAGLFAAMEAQGMTPLPNRGLYIRERFYLAGVQDKRRGPDIAKAIAGAGPESFILLLSHNPDVAMWQSAAEIDLILSGHTHGGNATFFGLWAPALTLTDYITGYGQRFMSGWALGAGDTPVFVSNGVGNYVPRVFARPQVILITLLHG